MLILQSERARQLMRKGTSALFSLASHMKKCRARSPNLRIVPAAIISLESNEITAGIYGCSRDCGRGMIIDDNRRKHMCIYPTARGGGGGVSPYFYHRIFIILICNNDES
jgi:hypothetical protein